MRTYYLTTICLGICVLFFWLNISVGFWGEKIENNARLSRHQLPASQQTEAFDFLGLFLLPPSDSCPWISVPTEEYTIPPCYIPVNRTNRKKTPGPFCVFKRWREHDQKNQVVKWTLPPQPKSTYHQEMFSHCWAMGQLHLVSKPSLYDWAVFQS